VHYAISDESPGAIIVAMADSPALDTTLRALAEASLSSPNEVVVAAGRSAGAAGLLGGRAGAAAGLLKWWRYGAGPAYVAPAEAMRARALTPLDRGPELAFLWSAARGLLGLRALAIPEPQPQRGFAA
jgi:hypothetical protein